MCFQQVAVQATAVLSCAELLWPGHLCARAISLPPPSHTQPTPSSSQTSMCADCSTSAGTAPAESPAAPSLLRPPLLLALLLLASLPLLLLLVVLGCVWLLWWVVVAGL